MTPTDAATTAAGPHLVFCSKSSWIPALRREHALAAEAVSRGIDVDFIEPPRDVRSLLRPRAQRPDPLDVDSVRPAGSGQFRVHRRWTPVPGHLGRVPGCVDGWTLRRSLKVLLRPNSVVVVYLPWQRLAVENLGRPWVFDATDDWSVLLPKRQDIMREHYRAIGGAATEVISVTPHLEHLFGGRKVTVVPNGAWQELIEVTPTTQRRPRSMVYVGTLSERFDHALVATVLAQLPDWTLDIYGPCHYAGQGQEPSPELTALLESSGGRATWHGVVPRQRLAAVLDAAQVGVIPSVQSHSSGQSSMKMFDYAARGLPIVSTPLSAAEMDGAPPGAVFARGADRFVAAVRTAGSAERDRAGAVAWAQERVWSARWHTWADAVFGKVEATKEGTR